MSMVMHRERHMVNLWSGKRACFFHYEEDVSNLYTSAAYTHLPVCKRRSISVCSYIYLSVPPLLAISTSCCSIGYDINRTRMVVTERAAKGRLVCQDMAGRI